MDYHKANEVTRKDGYLLPWIDDALDALWALNTSVPWIYIRGTGR